MKHVAFVIPGINRLGGAERQAILLAKGLAARGWRVSMVALSGNGGQMAAELEAAGVGFLSLRMRKGLFDPRGWVRFRRWLKAEVPDVLHTHLPHAVWMARGSRLFAPVRVIVDTVHTTRTGSRTQRALYRATGFLSDRVTAVSSAVAEAYISASMTSPARTLVLPNGIDTKAFEPDPATRDRMRSELGLTDNEFLWCAVGRLEPVKDYPTLLKAIAGLPERARLLIAGNGPLEPDLRRLAAALGIAQRVRFLGFQQDIGPWIQAVDAVVLSSLWEGLPMNLLEAGACALPCVATAVPGTREVVIDGKTGFLAPPGDVDALRQAMSRLMQMNPEARHAIGLNARSRIVRRFSLDAVLDRWESLYRDLLEQNAQPRRLAGLHRANHALPRPRSSGATADAR